MLSTPAKYLQKIDTMFGKSGEDQKPASRVSEPPIEGLEGLSEYEESAPQDDGDSQEGEGDEDGSYTSSLEASLSAVPR